MVLVPSLTLCPHAPLASTRRLSLFSVLPLRLVSPAPALFLESPVPVVPVPVLNWSLLPPVPCLAFLALTPHGLSRQPVPLVWQPETCALLRPTPLMPSLGCWRTLSASGASTVGLVSVSRGSWWSAPPAPAPPPSAWRKYMRGRCRGIAASARLRRLERSPLHFLFLLNKVSRSVVCAAHHSTLHRAPSKCLFFVARCIVVLLYL